MLVAMSRMAPPLPPPPPANPEAAYQWIMDPIDGTEDFVQHLPTFGSILALHYCGEPVVGVIDHPVLDMRVSAAFGLGAHYNGRRVTLTDLDPSAIDGTERVMLPASSTPESGKPIALAPLAVAIRRGASPGSASASRA